MSRINDFNQLFPRAVDKNGMKRFDVALCHGCHVAIHALRKTMQMWIDGKIEWPDKKQMVLF